MKPHSNKGLILFLSFATLLLVLGLLIGEKLFSEADDLSAPQDADQAPAHDKRGPGVLGRYALQEAPAGQMKLPRELEEISGLANAGGTIFAHDDERAIIYKLDPESAAIRGTFTLTNDKKPVKDDFEGIAVGNSTVYLVTSSGRIYEAQLPRSEVQGSLAFQRYETGIGSQFEIEGLAYDAGLQALVIVSKNSTSRATKGSVGIYFWSTYSKTLLDEQTIFISIRDLSKNIKGSKFQPTGIEKDAGSGNFLLVASQQHALAEISEAGEIIDVQVMQQSFHRQAEGITLGADAALLIANEAAGATATIAKYVKIDPPAVDAN